MAKKLSLSSLLKQKKFPVESESSDIIHSLQLKMLRIQQGVWHSRKRAIVVFEGCDAAGKGGAIRRLTESLDPRSVRVHPIGPPSAEEQGRHYLYRFWKALPEVGTIAIFDRSWYGRVLVERVENLIPEKRWKQAYDEINEFEKQLSEDGVDLIKVFLAIHPDEQLRRFEARLVDPYKQWKLTDDDIEAHKKWNQYVKAADDMLKLTNTSQVPWNLIPADSKEYARHQVLKVVSDKLSHHGTWIEDQVQKKHYQELRLAMKKIKRAQKIWIK